MRAGLCPGEINHENEVIAFLAEAQRRGFYPYSPIWQHNGTASNQLMAAEERGSERAVCNWRALRDTRWARRWLRRSARKRVRQEAMRSCGRGEGSGRGGNGGRARVERGVCASCGALVYCHPQGKRASPEWAQGVRVQPQARIARYAASSCLQVRDMGASEDRRPPAIGWCLPVQELQNTILAEQMLEDLIPLLPREAPPGDLDRKGNIDIVGGLCGTREDRGIAERKLSLQLCPRCSLCPHLVTDKPMHAGGRGRENLATQARGNEGRSSRNKSKQGGSNTGVRVQSGTPQTQLAC
jgi:hypothetical protein